MRDGKSRYDVTTPATAFAGFNVLSYRRSPDEVLDCIDRLCADAAFACLAELKQRRHCQHGSAAIDLVETIPLHRYKALLDRLDAVTTSRLGTVGASLGAGDLPLPRAMPAGYRRGMAIEPLAGTGNRHPLRLDTLSANEPFRQAGSGEVARDCLAHRSRRNRTL
ncbi:hypothetical protein NKH98_30090 [Mesorhizobium sp. M0833]|uniref:hypothetical protein n=1 Tax=Mesorhizobium sp. M0833 TaxID=2957009 RepID=UPI00333D13DA